MGLWEDVIVAQTHAEDREAVDNIVSFLVVIASLIGLIWGLIAYYNDLDTSIPTYISISSVVVSFISYFICCWIHSRSLIKPILVLLFLGGGSFLLYLLPAYDVWFFEWGNIFYFQLLFVALIRGFLPD